MGIYKNQSLNDSLQSSLSTESPSDSSSPLDARDPSRQLNRSALQDNSKRISALTQNQTAYSSSTTGVFTVGASGKVSFDFLFDGGLYQGEAAVFRLSGLEQFAPGSQEFIREAARRSLSNSNEGHVVISDSTESARFSGKFDWESAYNLGRYAGGKTFDMSSGDLLAILLVPNGTVQEIFNNPSLGGAKRPVFSVSTSNPNNATHVVGLKTVNADGQVIGIEDLREDGKSDRDFNDVIFYMEGATGDVVPIDAVIKPVYSWRTNEVGKQLLDFKPIQNILPPLPPIDRLPPPPDHWNAKFINFDNNTIADQPEFDTAIATLDLGKQRDNDGKIHLLQDFRTDSPAPKVNPDYFGMEASTETTLDADKLYKITSKSDDGTKFFLQKKNGEKKSITEFGGWTEGDWRDRSIKDPSIYFKVADPGQYELYVQYYDKEGNAAVDVTLEQAQPFSTEVDQSKKWQADVFWWDRTKGNQPLVKVDEAKNKIGAIDLGENKRNDGKSGIKFDYFGQDSLNKDSRMPGDNFAIVAYTEATFDDGKYTFQASGDDGFQIFAENLDNAGKKIAITPENKWQPIEGERSFSKDLKKGKYKISFAFYEERGDARFDLSWNLTPAPTPTPIPTPNPTPTPTPTPDPKPPGDPDGTLSGAAQLEFQERKGEKRDSIDGMTDKSDFLKFKIKENRTNVDFQLTGLSANADLQLIQDKNGNGQVDIGEVVAESSLFDNLERSISYILGSGDYFIRIFAESESIKTFYNLGFSSTILSEFLQIDNQSVFKEPINFWRYDIDGRTERNGGTNQGVTSSRETVVVIHGFDNNDEVPKLKELAKEISKSDVQVLSLDWSTVARAKLDGFGAPYKTAEWIAPVAGWAYSHLVDLGITSDKLSLAGHSLGAYVSAEIAKLFGKVKSLVTLDPAFPADGDNGYDIDTTQPNKQNPASLGLADNSLSLVVADDGGGLLGDNDKASTAGNSFLIALDSGQRINMTAVDAHSAVIDAFTDALSRKLLTFPDLKLPDHQNNWYDNNGDKDNFLDRQFNPGKHEGQISVKWTGKDLDWKDGSNPWGITELAQVTDSSGKEERFWT